MADQWASGRFINRLRIFFIKTRIKSIPGHDVTFSEMRDGLLFGETIGIKIDPRNNSGAGIGNDGGGAGKLADLFVVSPGHLSFVFVTL